MTSPTTVQSSGPTRKQRFEAALKLAGMTAEQWRTAVYPVSAQHLNEVFRGNREPSAELSAAIDAMIVRHLGESHGEAA